MNKHTYTWPRLYLETPLSQGARLALDSKQSHYLTQVMRLKLGDSTRLFNGQAGEWKAVLVQAPNGKKNGAILEVEASLRAQEQDSDLWLCAAPIKKQHFDFVIAKATELGASVIQPVLTERTQIRSLNLEHARAIAIEAAEQSERLSLPDIREPMSLQALCEGWPQKRLILLCAEHGPARPIAEALDGALAKARTAAAIFIGPEGGFAREELEKIQSLPEVLSLRLGPRILRADTAALSALACWQALRGDWKA